VEERAGSIGLWASGDAAEVEAVVAAREEAEEVDIFEGAKAHDTLDLREERSKGTQRLWQKEWIAWTTAACNRDIYSDPTQSYVW
jgi:hypothetical protein